jgi:hypothetical protein
MNKKTKIIREIKIHKRFLILMLTSFILSVLYVVFSFFPCIQVVNKTTGQIDPKITAISVAFGHSGSNPFVNGNTLSLVSYLISLFCFIFIAIFIIWMLNSKSANRLKYILLALSILSTSAGLFFCATLPLIFTTTNSMYSTDFYQTNYTVFGYLSLIFMIVSLLINILAMFYIAIKTQKKSVVVEEK